MSNMNAQTAYLNRVLWKSLEMRERALVDEGHRLFIIAGTIYPTDGAPVTIGPQHDISVPRANFKIIVVANPNDLAENISDGTGIIAAVLDNITTKGTLAVADKTQVCADEDPKANLTAAPGVPTSWTSYLSTMGQIESLTGYSFFPALNSQVHSSLAAKASDK